MLKVDILARERSKTKGTTSDFKVPNSYVYIFPACSKVSGSPPGKGSPEGPNLKWKRAKIGTKKCPRCEVYEQSVSIQVPFSFSWGVDNKLVRSSVAVYFPVEIARKFGIDPQLVNTVTRLVGESVLIRIYVSLTSSRQVSFCRQVFKFWTRFLNLQAYIRLLYIGGFMLAMSIIWTIHSIVCNQLILENLDKD